MKLNKILPMAALVGVTTFATPLTTSCSRPKGDGYILLDTEGEYVSVGGTAKFLRTKENVNFDTTSIYSVKFSWEKASDINCLDQAGGWQIMCGCVKDDGTLIPNSISEEDIVLHLDDRELQKDVDYKLQSAAGSNIIIPLKKLELNTNNIIKAQFKLQQVGEGAESGWIGVVGRPS